MFVTAKTIILTLCRCTTVQQNIKYENILDIFRFIVQRVIFDMDGYYLRQAYTFRQDERDMYTLVPRKKDSSGCHKTLWPFCQTSIDVTRTKQKWEKIKSSIPPWRLLTPPTRSSLGAAIRTWFDLSLLTGASAITWYFRHFIAAPGAWPWQLLEHQKN